MYNAQSINQRLKNFAKANGISNIERVRVILCLERVIARLVQDEYLCSKLIFGGGFVLYKEVGSQRFTSDIDAIISDIDKKKIIEFVNRALNVDLDDGFWFGDVRIIELEIGAGYGGIRLKIPYKAGLPKPTEDEITKLRSVQLDIAVGLNLEDLAQKSDLNSTLDIYSSVEWNIYPLEYICAEKLHCLFSKGDLNTRGKDIYDLGILLPTLPLQELEKAIIQVFKTRGADASLLYKKILEVNQEYLLENFLKILPSLSSKDFDKSWDTIEETLNELSLR